MHALTLVPGFQPGWPLGRQTLILALRRMPVTATVHTSICGVHRESKDVSNMVIVSELKVFCF